MLFRKRDNRLISKTHIKCSVHRSVHYLIHLITFFLACSLYCDVLYAGWNVSDANWQTVCWFHAIKDETDLVGAAAGHFCSTFTSLRGAPTICFAHAEGLPVCQITRCNSATQLIFVIELVADGTGVALKIDRYWKWPWGFLTWWLVCRSHYSSFLVSCPTQQVRADRERAFLKYH